MSMILEAQTRTDMGKGASRRLRRLENKIPAVLYGGSKKPKAIHLLHNKVLQALEVESIYSSVFELQLDGKTEKVILKDLQRHPYKPVIMHMDFQRVSAKDVLVKLVPLHFINEESAKGVKAGGVLSHLMTQIEVRCQAQHLPPFIEVDVANMEMDDVLHISDLQLPKDVHLVVDLEVDEDQNKPVVSLHMPKIAPVEEEAPVVAEEEAKAEDTTAESKGDDSSES